MAMKAEYWTSALQQLMSQNILFLDSVAQQLAHELLGSLDKTKPLPEALFLLLYSGDLQD
jgi:hypothetical protein